MRHFLSRDNIQHIVQHDDLLLRNLQITQGYFRLSERMRRAIGSSNVSWCSFATHASKTAGQALRHELIPGSLKSAMIRLSGHADTFAFYNHVLADQERTAEQETANALAEALKKVSLLVSEGNMLVFKELGWPFLDFANRFRKAWAYNGADLGDFLEAHFRPGALEDGGQDLLIEAFTAYYNARFETNRKRKAEYILQANLLIGLHEQTRLQPQIEAALAVPLDSWIRYREQPVQQGLPQKRLDEISRRIVTRAATRMWMSITLPTRVLRLGENVVPPTGVHSFPHDLLFIEDPRCRALVSRFDYRQDTLSGSAADNWSSLADRMNFVVAFFRSHQQSKRLFEPPFSVHQADAIEAGHIPAGPL